MSLIKQGAVLHYYSYNIPSNGKKKKQMSIFQGAAAGGIEHIVVFGLFMRCVNKKPDTEYRQFSFLKVIFLFLYTSDVKVRNWYMPLNVVVECY